MQIHSIDNIVQRVLSLYNKGVQSDESRLTPRHIYSVVLSNRSTLLEQQSKKKQKINQVNYQTIILEMEQVDSVKVACSNIPLDCSSFRTKKPLPKILSDMNKLLIHSISTIDNNIFLSLSEPSKSKYKNKGNRYAKSNDNTYYIEDGYLYTNSLEVLKITALFDDPIEVERYNSDCSSESNSCKSNYEFDFKCDTSLLSTIIQMSAEELIEWFNKSREDISNNSRDSILEETK